MTEKLNVTAYQEGKWWTFEIPELGSTASNGAFMKPVGQARSAAEVADEALDVAASWTDRNPSEFEISAVNFLPPGEIPEA